MTCRRRCGAFVLLGLLLLIVSTYAQNMYCGRRECYDILGLRGQETTATTADIRRAYRILSLQFHPDKNPSPDAAQIFQEIATAYEVLSGGLSRQAYDHYLNNPDDHAYNYGMHVYHVYAPKSDYRVIGIVFILFLSLVQYYAQLHRHKQALAYFRESKDVVRKAQSIQSSRRAQASRCDDQAKTRQRGVGGKDKKQKKEHDRAELTAIVDELMENVEISGGYAKPSVANLLVVRLALLPVTIAKVAQWHLTWWFKYTVRNNPFAPDDVEYLTCKALGISPEYFHSDQFIEDRDEVLSRELWQPENMLAYQHDLAARWKRKYPTKYKQMLASRKRAGVPDLEPEDSDYDNDSD
ncbi:hypothetical protein H310_07248 [Aphanomyces invadans]|uniref:J domain-containing protein n=1 Tax=Aphanomyces invadans TaxID=157072 RepID=A0A024U359_9STRA|nr:hypothetical protein H310_07248 [Aphanomyces invadans]ETW00689.1 hypothetical protein H310_07248 [Aphanomyces invadans]|eukprot:XP_008870824.1 hypothetical protein H310_07248 [Aphanomyces invadans]